MDDFSDNLSHWQALDQWLSTHRNVWSPAPFNTPAPDWVSAQPDLAMFLENLDDPQVAALEEDPAALAELLSTWLPDLVSRAELLELPQLGGVSLALPEARAVDMPGRKREQAGAFAAAVRPLQYPVLDWCCGKGHLARTLAPFARTALSGFEWNAVLVEQGNALARRYGDPVSLRTQDVLAPDLAWPKQCHGVALHACGDLHRRLILGATEQRWPRISLSPCCFHLTANRDYHPLSRRVRETASVTDLSRQDIRLAVRETVTAPRRVRRQTGQSQTWRLGFDALQRHLRGVDTYLSLPSHPTALNQRDFEAFCHWAANKCRIMLPASVDYDAWLRLGERRRYQVRRHELLRHLFRRPLEIWIVLDYALYFEENGYNVRLGTFCDRALTPRNLLLDARLEAV